MPDELTKHTTKEAHFYSSGDMVCVDVDGLFVVLGSGVELNLRRHTGNCICAVLRLELLAGTKHS